MNIKENKENTAGLFILGTLIVLAASVGLSYLTMYFAEATSAATGDMVTFVYGAGTLAIGGITIAGYIGTAAISGIGISMMLEPNKK